MVLDSARAQGFFDFYLVASSSGPYLHQNSIIPHRLRGWDGWRQLHWDRRV